jgi:photosystem II stability/assembly factor-like uncharacterized protein
MGTNNGIYRTTDGGSTWTRVSNLSPTWDPLIASDGTVYFASGNTAVLKGTQQGLTWTSCAKAGGGSGFYVPVEMPDASIVAIGSATLVQSANGGTTWKSIGSALPVSGMTQSDLAYDEVTGTFFMAYWDCTSTIPANALWKQVFSSTSVSQTVSPGRQQQCKTNVTRVLAGRVAIASQLLGTSAKIVDLYGRQLHPVNRSR